MDRDPKFEVGDVVHITAITSKRFVGPIKDRMCDEGDWFYTIDGKNYLMESMLEKVAPTCGKRIGDPCDERNCILTLGHADHCDDQIRTT